MRDPTATELANDAPASPWRAASAAGQQKKSIGHEAAWVATGKKKHIIFVISIVEITFLKQTFSGNDIKRVRVYDIYCPESGGSNEPPVVAWESGGRGQKVKKFFF